MREKRATSAEQIVGLLKDNVVNLIILSIILAGGWVRIFSYGSLFLSVGMLDTESYINSSVAMTSLSTAFTGRRLITTNLLYKLIDRQQNCELIATSNPDSGEEGDRELQPCFNNIVFTQNVMSILGWSLLAWTTARSLKSPLYKVIVSTIIILFGITPQIAEWDSVLSSESLSVSLFPIIVAVGQVIYINYHSGHGDKSNIRITILMVVWGIVFIAWLFIRDVHIYSILIAIVLLIPFLFIRGMRNRMAILTLVALLGGLFVLGNYTSKKSSRWQQSLEHVLDAYIFPYPARVEFFTNLGMPESKTSNEYTGWFNTFGLNSYGKFLVTHPGFLATTILEKSAYLKSDFIQPHFKSSENKHRPLLLVIGEIVHPETNAVYIIDFILIISLWLSYFRSRNSRSFGWAWLGTWMFLYSSVSLLLTLFGDIDGTRRHIYPSVELFRLFLWIFLMIQADQLLEKDKPLQDLKTY